jgi:hypothetical protein
MSTTLSEHEILVPSSLGELGSTSAGTDQRSNSLAKHAIERKTA